MNSRQKQISAGVIVAVVVATGVGAWMWRPANNDNFPDGTYWICSEPTCKTEFSLTMTQLSDHHEKHYGQPVPCPKCGKPAIRADKCKHCGRIYPMDRNSVVCPFCGKPNFQPAGDPAALAPPSGSNPAAAAVRGTGELIFTPSLP